MSGCLLRWKCLVACLFFDESQQPTWPHSRHKPQMDPRIASLDALFAHMRISGFKFDLLHVAAILGHGFSLGRTSGGLLSAFQCSAVPLRHGRAGFIGALQKFQYRGSRRTCAAGIFMHQQKFAQLLMIKRRLPDALSARQSPAAWARHSNRTRRLSRRHRPATSPR